MALMTPPWAFPQRHSLWPLPHRVALPLRGPEHEGHPKISAAPWPPRLPFTLVCRCFCSAFRELIWSRATPTDFCNISAMCGHYREDVRTRTTDSTRLQGVLDEDRNPPRAFEPTRSFPCEKVHVLSFERAGSPSSRSIARSFDPDTRTGGEETERAAPSATLAPEGTKETVTAWRQRVGALLGCLLGTRVTGVHLFAQMVCAERVETGRGSWS
jgi:hypothetical protein